MQLISGKMVMGGLKNQTKQAMGNSSQTEFLHESLQDPALNSCPDFASDWAITCKMKQTLSLKVAFSLAIYHSNRNLSAIGFHTVREKFLFIIIFPV